MLVTSLSCIYSASCNFEEAYIEVKIKVNEKVKSEMSRLIKSTSKPCAFASVTDRQFIPNKNNLVSECWISPLLAPPPHIDDVRSDYNIQKADVNIFVESKVCSSDGDDAYQLREFTLCRNYFSQSNIRTCYGTAVYLLMF